MSVVVGVVIFVVITGRCGGRRDDSAGTVFGLSSSADSADKVWAVITEVPGLSADVTFLVFHVDWVWGRCSRMTGGVVDWREEGWDRSERCWV